MALALSFSLVPGKSAESDLQNNTELHENKLMAEQFPLVNFKKKISDKENYNEILMNIAIFLSLTV